MKGGWTGTAVVAALFAAAPAFAQTVVVPTDYPSIEAAINAASDGWRIEVLPGVYNEYVMVDKSIELVGIGGSSQVTIVSDGDENNEEALHVHWGVSATVTGFSLRSTGDLRAMRVHDTGTTLVASDLDIRDVTYSGTGAGLRVNQEVDIRLSDSVFVNNTSDVDGGHIWITTGTLTLDNVAMSLGTADRGGAIAADAADVRIVDSHSFDNTARIDGGAVYGKNGSSILIEGGIFERNNATSSGGHAAIDGGSLDVRGTRFEDGGARDGGAIDVVGGYTTVASAVFDNTVAQQRGGGAHITGGKWASFNSQFLGTNAAGGGGGGIFVESSEMTSLGDTFSLCSGGVGGAVELLSGSQGRIWFGTFTDNQANYGGAVAAWWSDELSVVGTHFEGNQTDPGGGGAISVFETPDLELGFSVLWENQSEDDGGALRAEGVDFAEVIGNVFCENEADDGGAVFAPRFTAANYFNNAFAGNGAVWGGGLYLETGQVLFENNSVLGNDANSGGGVRLFGTWGFSSSHSVYAHQSLGDGVRGAAGAVFGSAYGLWWNNSDNDVGGTIAGALGPTDVFLDPGPLGYVGDCTLDDYLPRPGSPLIDGGDTSLTDPDGSIRDLGVSGGPYGECPCEQRTLGSDTYLFCRCDRRWPQAQAECAKRGAELTDLEVAAENSLVAAQASSYGLGSPWWSGLSDVFAEGSFRWMDGTPQEGFLPWASTEPSADVDCVAFTEAGVWEARDCSNTLPFVCEFCETPAFVDADRDGYGDPAAPVLLCDVPVGFSLNDLDCDDTNPGVHPFADEVCDDNDVDENCDDVSDDVGAIGETLWYLDGDGDQFGDSDDAGIRACDPPTALHVGNADDCDDNVESVNPDAVEVCDDANVDENCANGGDEPGAQGESVWYVDSDQDGFGALATAGLLACDAPFRHVRNANDCNDGNPDVNPDAPEVCDDVNVDENCNFTAEESGAVGEIVWFSDNDADGFGDQNDPGTLACDPPTSTHVPNALDCDDAVQAINPAADELCDAADIDENCNGSAEETGALGETGWYVDTDGDSFGDLDGSAVFACEPPTSQHVSNAQDCDDSTELVSPAAPEVCDAADVDENCNGSAEEAGATGEIVWAVDGDGDGFGDEQDVGILACDAPTMGHVSNALDCDDSAMGVNPAASEVCDPDDIDENCDGLANGPDAEGAIVWVVDTDGDGFGSATETGQLACEAPTPGHVSNALDCDDASALVSPSALEVCDALNVDENCSGQAEEAGAAGETLWYLDADGDTYGDASDEGMWACDAPVERVADRSDCNDAADSVHPDGVEVCDPLDVDEDCDGLVDDADPDTVLPAWYGDGDGDGYGAGSPTFVCDRPVGAVEALGDCDDEEPAIHPGALETCGPEDVDEDCDGLVDDADPDVTGQLWYPDLDQDGFGDQAAPAASSCEPPLASASTSTDCDDGSAEVFPGATEIWYDGVDQDCDGRDDDRDEDGFLLVDDCNDDDPAINPEATDILNDGFDQDCSGADRLGWYRSGAGCGCQSSGGGLPMGLGLLALVALTRRRFGRTEGPGSLG